MHCYSRRTGGEEEGEGGVEKEEEEVMGTEKRRRRRGPRTGEWRNRGERETSNEIITCRPIPTLYPLPVLGTWFPFHASLTCESPFVHVDKEGREI